MVAATFYALLLHYLAKAKYISTVQNCCNITTLSHLTVLASETAIGIGQVPCPFYVSVGNEHEFWKTG